MHSSTRAVLGALLVWSVAACGRGPDEPADLRLLGFQQAQSGGVLLNEPLVFHFSGELDPTSVTPSSARVLDPAGRLVPGAFRVEGARLIFEPALALQADLSDGGFLPGSLGRVELSGFPVPSGLRSRRGEVLHAGFSSTFETVRQEGDGALYLDGSPDTAFPLLLSELEIGVSEAIQLTCAEPLDPRSLFPSAFQLRRYEAGGEHEEIALEVRLASNTMEEGARLELRALESPEGGAPRVLEPGEYHLWIHEGATAPRDLAGHPVRSSWATSQVPARISVGLRANVTGNRWHREEFLSRALRSPAAVPGVDGAALWAGDGLLRLRFPKCAGDGAAGVVQLGTDVTALRASRGDLHCAQLEIPSDQTVDLSEFPDTVILRSQTSVRLSGRLLRRSADVDTRREDGEAWGPWFGRVGMGQALGELAGKELGSVDAWLAGRTAEESPLTVIITAGDLWVDGEIQVDGPLLLVAGGRLRVSGVVEARETWVVGLGGGPDLHPPAREAGLSFQETSVNALKLPLAVGVLSAPLRPAGRELRWRSAQVGAHAGAGAVRVRFLGERDLPDGGVETVGPVPDAALLDRCESIRAWIELEIGPGPSWDPPMVDFVEFRWTEETEL